MISFPAPALCQVADEDLMVSIGAVMFPECIKRWPGENGLRLWVDGTPTDTAARVDAVAKFQTVLGVLRAWRQGAGQLAEELRAGLGHGSVRDEAGNQWVLAGPAVSYGISGGEVERLAADASRGITGSQNLRNALWLNGRANRTAADYYMIHEYAGHQFNGSGGITKTLGLSGKSQGRLTQSANNLSPLQGGRHASHGGIAPLTLDEQGGFIADLLRRWIER
ncbi:hypothetical protein AB0C12_24350 [Actinoplanes sp. NPDC048967]|uniref:hypothetical protein n=1 Tax=Actinoplanes sp. NPDC048967 TaxID=3155269 RepID=UPI0033DAA887